MLNVFTPSMWRCSHVKQSHLTTAENRCSCFPALQSCGVADCFNSLPALPTPRTKVQVLSITIPLNIMHTLLYELLGQEKHFPHQVV